MLIRITGLLAVIAAGLFACSSTTGDAGGVDQPAAPQAATAGAAGPEAAVELPDFPMTDQLGNTVQLRDLKGKKVFVNLWASWCPPCRAEMPSIEQLKKKTQNGNVAFVMLALDNDFNTSKAFMQQKKLDLPAYYPAGPLPELFNVPGIPATFIFDESGKLVKKVEGASDYDTEAYVKLLTQ